MASDRPAADRSANDSEKDNNMKIIPTLLDGVFIIEVQTYPDQRGYFLELYQERRYMEMGISARFVQDNCSHSTMGVIRGLHYQAGDSAQAKLVSVLSGKVFDVAVDIRFGSPTFGRHVMAELSAANARQLFVPTGYAHGFAVVSDSATVLYKCTANYAAQEARTIRFDDQQLGIPWPVKAPILSPADAKGIAFAELPRDFAV